MANPRQLQPTVEDYSSDDSDHDSVVVENFRRSPGAQGQANVAAKRSHPSDLGTEKSPVLEKVVHSDLQSDSGYSSHTAATMSSADSAPSAKSQSPPVAPVNAAPIPPSSPAPKRRPTLDKHSSSQSSPRKPLQRTGSVSSRNRPPRERRPTVTEDCTDPKCTKCDPHVRGRRPKPSPLDSGLDLSYPPFDQRSQRSDPVPPASYVSPQSPTYRQPHPYLQGSAIIQPAQSTRTRRSSSTARARPVSYHGGNPSQQAWVHGMPAPYPSPPQEHASQYGPPPASSAYQTMQYPQMNQYGMVGATPPSTFYPPGHPMQTSPPYDSQRPPMTSRTSSNFNARRPVSQYGPTPLITQDQNSRSMPSARYPSAPQSASQAQFPQSQMESDSESSDYESSYEDNARALMPPPKITSSTQRRPSLRRPNTTQVYNSERRMSQSLTLEPPRERERDPRASRVSTAPSVPSRAASISRPALDRKSHSAYETARNAQVVVENSRSRRRQSYQTYDKQYEVEPKRRSKVYQDEGGAHPGHRRRQTDVDPRRRGESVSQPKFKDVSNDVEAYLQRTRGSDTPLNDKVHHAAKRASRVHSGPSDAGSSNSKGSDKASRVSHSNRTTVTNGGGGGEIRLRVDATAPLSLQFNGDMEGRTLQINPAEGGMADIVIGGAREENTYSQRASVVGNNSSRKSVVSNHVRREAEESSVRSSQSRRDRDGERRPLRRRREIDYNA